MLAACLGKKNQAQEPPKKGKANESRFQVKFWSEDGHSSNAHVRIYHELPILQIASGS